MENYIYEKLIKARDGDKDCLEEIIKIFDPLISKYSRLLDSEDTKHDLSVHLIRVINKIPIKKDYFNKDKFIVGYIVKSIRNEYIRLSKLKNKKESNETQLNLDIEMGYEKFDSDIELIDLFNKLSKMECNIMKLIYINRLSVSEIANDMEISRQAVNQVKNRALNKIRNIYLT